MERDTRARLLAAAKEQFAEKGFYGASIAGVAGELGLSKQALLYHFKRKEDLYAEVLQEISERLLRFVRVAAGRAGAPERQLEDILLGLYVTSRESPLDTRILVRELLDNQARAETAKDWYLRPFLGEIVAVVQQIRGLEKMPFAAAFSMIYPVIGAIQYFAISAPTLARMYGAEEFERIRDEYPIELRNQIRRLVDDQVGRYGPGRSPG